MVSTTRRTGCTVHADDTTVVYCGSLAEAAKVLAYMLAHDLEKEPAWTTEADAPDDLRIE